MNVVEVNRKSLGAHELYTISPDVIVFKIRGVLGEPEARGFIAYVVELVAKHGANVYAIYDMSEFTRLSSSVRSLVLGGAEPYPYSAVAIAGASFTTRTFVDMFSRATRVIASKNFGFPVKFVNTTDEGLHWFDQIRSESRPGLEGS